MKIVLTSIENNLADAWKKFCGDLDFVKVHLGSIFDAQCTTLVSPANSFGFMDGGIDSLYSQRFGSQLQIRVQTEIKKVNPTRELLVGQALIVATGANGPLNRWMVITPTMRVPMVLSKNTINPYLAIKAALTVAKNSGIESIAFPGMGTGVGKVSPEKCAMQMREAIDEVILEQGMFPNGWMDAKMRHEYLATGKVIPFEKQSQKAFEE